VDRVGLEGEAAGGRNLPRGGARSRGTGAAVRAEYDRSGSPDRPSGEHRGEIAEGHLFEVALEVGF
jgi:hypothetical protein